MSSRAARRGSLHTGARREAACWEPNDLTAEAAPGMNGAGPAGEAEPEPQVTLSVTELEARLASAHARGLEQGRAEGAAAEATRLDTGLAALAEVVAAFELQQPVWLGALETNFVALSTAMAREIVGREVKGQAEDIADLVHRAISDFPLDVAIRVRLNPADLTAISSPLHGDALRAGRPLRWVPDPTISPGGCLVEGPESLVDGRVEKALEHIYHALIYG